MCLGHTIVYSNLVKTQLCSLFVEKNKNKNKDNFYLVSILTNK